MNEKVKDFGDPNLEFDLAMHIHRLLKSEPFFNKISRYLRKVPFYQCETLGVRFNENSLSFELLYNPKFLANLIEEHGETLGDQLVRSALMHEFYHCALGHLTSRKFEDTNPQFANVVMDLAINSLPGMLEVMKKFTWKLRDENGKVVLDDKGEPIVGRVCLPERFELPNEQTAEWYLAALKNKQGDGGNGSCEGEGEGSGRPGSSKWNPHDHHDDFSSNGGGNAGESIEDKISESMREIAASKMKEIVEKATKECDQSDIRGGEGWGSVSQSMRKEIRKAFKQPLDPKSVLRYFIKTSERADRRASITKINKRWKYVHPGKRWNRRPKIAISMDMSGSVSDEMLVKFFSWLNEFATFADFTVIPFDHQVFEDKVFVWKKGQSRPAIRVLCGGTDFNAPTDYVNARDFDGHIVLTDLCAPTPKKSKCQRMWVTTESCLRYNYLKTKEKILAVDKTH